MSKLIKIVVDKLGLCGDPRPVRIQDSAIPPFTTQSNQQSPTTALPTDARVRQKQRLAKMKEHGLKPKTKRIHIEDGKEDCSDDITSS